MPGRYPGTHPVNTMIERCNGQFFEWRDKFSDGDKVGCYFQDAFEIDTVSDLSFFDKGSNQIGILPSNPVICYRLSD